jgi:3-oxoacyl-[acyl-carrier protein] reductase
MSDLSGKTALVTGGSRGIGRAIARRLASDGATVAVHYGNNKDAAQETVAAVEASCGRAFAVGADLTDAASTVDELFTQLDETLRAHTGDTRLDILVNNAGIGLQKPIEDVTAEEFNRVHAVNVQAPFLVTQRALPRLPDGGRIINISSGVTRIAYPSLIAYSMTKGALDVFTKTLAQHLGSRGITVNAVSPGIVATDINAAWLRDNEEAQRIAANTATLGRVGQPDDIADVVAFVASDDARWVTGQAIDATGGSFLGA